MTGRAVDLTGQTFGELTAIEPTVVNGFRGWLCSCSCGGLISYKTSQLTTGDAKTCKGLVHRVPYSVGETIADLTILSFYKEKRRKARWMAVCLCKCGNEHHASIRNLQRGATRNCGCDKDYSNCGLPGNIAARNKVIGVYRDNAKRKGRVFELSKDECIRLFEANCFYCNQPPSNYQPPSSKNKEGYYYNGIDRMDNNVGYLISNVVPCCLDCNRLKFSRSHEDFLNKVRLIYEHQKSKGTKHSIDISEKKGIPIVIDPDKIPNGVDDDTIVNFMVKRHLCNSLVFPVGTNETDYLAKIEEYTGDNILEHLTSMHEASVVKPEYLNGTSLEYMFQPIMDAGYPGRVIQKALVTILKFKDVVTPKVVNKVYMKLDTGGLSGYRRDLRAKGEEVYPILRITVKVNSHDPLDIIINPGDKEGVVDDKTREIHTNSGLWLEALKSEISLAKARSMVEDYFKLCNLRNTNPTDNIHTHLVGFNTAFIRSFVQAQLPGLLGMCSPRDVDVNQLSSLLEISSSYEHIPVPQIWRNDPVRYINSLEHCVNSIIDPTYSEDVPF